ncbi:helix-turn-helix transcriptional regulator [uncultured Alistipes sp.]|jgi:transcriptional regulator, AraC family|uniref:helix-turn-helix transcriptional regulator n=1 Tax=uncultured Alistipes sp. TaxID=538949 RepID=UPI0025E18F96|nr:helix-turn-helix transcriptional regulator [uncultured Alistipes sp.]
MEVEDIYEHQACRCYDHSDEQVVKLMRFPKGEVSERVALSNKIMFTLEGSIRSQVRNEPPITSVRGSFAFAPTGTPIQCKALKDTLVLSVSINGNMHLCSGFGIERLFIRANNQNRDAQIRPKYTSLLKMNTELWKFVGDMTSMLAKDMRCKHYYNIKVQELLALLRIFYTKEQLHDFFYYILSPDTVFSEFVNANWLKCNSVQGLASAINLSPQHFSKKFKTVFKTAPGKWLAQEKARCVLDEIQNGKKTFQQISSDYGFTAVPNFYRFCKAMFGETPQDIRSKKKNPTYE